MKKLLSIITAVTLVGPTATSVISCAPKIEHDVLFVLPGTAMAKAGKIPGAYKAIVKDFNNSEEMKNSDIKVKVEWENGDSIMDRILSNQQLPDLYVSYPDAVTQYAYGDQKNDIRDMAATAGKTAEEMQNLFWDKSFYDEGLVNGQLDVLDVNKSFDLSIVNVKLLVEIMTKIGINPQEAVTSAISKESKPIFNEDSYEVEVPKGLKTNLEAIKDIDGVREFFKLDQNVLDLANVYNQMYRIDKQNGKNIEQKMYSFGLDDIPNKMFMEYADKMGKSVIDPANDKDFIYNVGNIKLDEGAMDININGDKNNITFKGIDKYFQTFEDLAKKNGGNNSDIYLQWNGSAMIGGMGTGNKQYSSSYFKQGTMIESSSSSAGTFAFSQNLKYGNYDSNQDLITVGASTQTGNKFNFVSQGPGIAGFKSVGDNKDKKEEVTSKFINYLLEPKVANKLAILAGYMPSSTGGMNRFINYKNGNFSNVTGQWAEGVAKPEDADDYEIVDTGKYKDQKDKIITDFLENYVKPQKPSKTFVDNTQLVVTVANPAGSILRTSITNALKTIIFNELKDFNSLIDDNGKRYPPLYTLKRQVMNSLPGYLSESNVKVIKEKK